MGSVHTPADDIAYDWISIQYHALQGGQTYAHYLQDADGHPGIPEFIRQVQTQDGGRVPGAV